MRIKVFALSLCAALLFSLPLATPVQADVGMTPSEGITGTAVTVTELSTGTSYTIKWDGEDYQVGTVTSGIVIFTVPAEACGGNHDVVVESPTGTPFFAGSFSVLPSIVIDPNSGTVGTSVTVDGNGFAAAETGIKVTYGGTTVKSGITANDDGSWSTTVIVPSSTKGSHIVDAYGNTTETDNVTDKTFTVSPKIALTPSSGGVGTPVTVDGTGFAAAETDIKVMYGGEEMRTGIIAGDNGSWSAVFTVPSSIRGAHLVDVSGSSTTAANVPNITFTVASGVSLDINSGYIGDDINVTGNGFVDSETGIEVTFDGEILKKNIIANDDGYWTTSLTIPNSINGAHTIDAYGATTLAADVSNATLNILAQIVLNPEEGNVGDEIKVRGTGFKGNKDATITYGNDTVVTGLTTDSTGTFSTSFEAPEGKSGECVVTATDAGDVTASATFTMEATPPDLPQIASPKDGGRVGFIGDTITTFDWTDISDPSGIYYSVQVSTQSNFAIPLLTHTDLTDSEYTLTAAEALPHGEYYWRVKAIDRAGNASDWTAPALVKAGFMTSKTFIIIVASVVVIIILAIVLPKVLRRKSKKRIAF